MPLSDIVHTLWSGLGWPLTKLIFFVSLGILVANFIEALNWSHKVARISAPLVRLGHLPETVGISFSMAFFSGIAANSMLSEAFDQGKICKKELILANLLNSLPTYFLHLPTVFFITVPLIKGAAVIYVGLTFLAAFLRTLFIFILSRALLGAREYVTRNYGDEAENTKEKCTICAAAKKSWQRFRKKIKKIVMFTVPIYTMIFALNRAGLFDWLENFMAENFAGLGWLQPEAMSIVVFHVAAELAAGLAAAGALLDSGNLSYREVVLALLVGNIVSSPMRAIRHQFPYYAGIFSPKLATELIFYNQIFRCGSIVIVAVGYYLYTL